MTSIPLLNLVKQEVSKNNQKIVRGTKKLNDFLEGLENRIADLENLKVEEIETN
jgi:phosphoserine phosphatase